MFARLTWLAANLSLCWSLSGQPAMLLQSPVFGRLTVASDPAGAKITIDGTPRQEVTNFTYVVGPGNYTVAVSGGPGNLTCPARSVSVSANTEATVTCTAKGWQ
jgi:hypothetical protein